MAESDYGVSGSNAFWAPINKKIEQRHDDEESLKKDKRAFYSGIAANPSATDDVRNWAVGEHAKLLNPETAKKLKQGHPIVHAISKLMGIGGDPSQPQPSGPIPAPPPGPVIDTPAQQARQLEYQKQLNAITTAGKVEVEKNKPVSTGTKRNLQYKLPDGSIVGVQQDSKSGQYFTPQGDPFSLPEGAEPYKPEAAGVTRREYFTDPEDKDQKPRLVYVDPKHPDKRIDAETMQPAKGNLVPFNMEQHIAQVRGSQYGTGMFNSLVAAYKAQGDSDDEAKAKAGPIIEENIKRDVEKNGATKYTERPMVVNGEVRAVPIQSGIIPRPVPAPASGPVGPPAAAPAGGAPPAAPRSAAPAGATRPAPAAGPRPAPTAAAAPPAAGGGRVLGMPVAQYRSQLNDIRAVRAGAGQLFGDPNVPSVHGLVDYSDLADNKDSREKLGKALRLTFDGLDQSSSGGHAGVSGEGASLNVGGIGTWVGNQLGIPTAVAGQQAKMLQDAVSALTPREREAYNATISSAEGIIGLRRITGAGPSLQSVRAIQEAMPIIGVNTTDKKQFDDKAQRLAIEFSAGTRGIPTAGFDAETRKQLEEINKLPERLTKGKAAPAAGPKAAPKPAPPKKGDKVDGYVFQGGDPADQKNWKK